jgi:glutamate---cysteine ligase / carboxylate-amine ligase
MGQAALDHDEGRLGAPLRQREVEENLWRAIRHGMDGRMIDFGHGTEVPTVTAVESLVEWCAPAAALMGIELGLPATNGAQRARAALAEGTSIEDLYREAIAETRATYAPVAAA